MTMSPCKSFQQVILRYSLLLVLVTMVTAGEVGSTTVSGNGEEMCPCLPMGKCPRMYGQSATDIRELGFQVPCQQFGTVRCCGVTIRIEHEKDSERNSSTLIGSPRTMGIQTNYTVKGTNTVGDMPWTPNGTATTGRYPTTWSSPVGSPMTKLRRRKLSGGASKGLIQGIHIGNFTQAPLKNSSGPLILRPNILSRLKGKPGDVTTTLPSSQQASSSSVVTSMTSGAKRPVFTRIRKQPAGVHVGIKVDLPVTVSGAQMSISGEQKESGSPVSITSPVPIPFKTVLDLGINVHDSIPPTLNLSTISSESATEETRKQSISPKFEIARTNNSRPTLIGRTGVKKVIPVGTIGEIRVSGSHGQVVEKIGESPPPAAIKLRRPLRRRPSPATSLHEAPQVSSPTIHLTIPGSNSLLPESIPMGAIKTEEKEAGNRPPTHKYRKRIRIHPITTTTTTSIPPIPNQVTPSTYKEERPEIENAKFQESRPFQQQMSTQVPSNQEQILVEQEDKKEYLSNFDQVRGHNPSHVQGYSQNVQLNHVKVEQDNQRELPEYHHHVHSKKPSMTLAPPAHPTLITPEVTHLMQSSWQTYVPSTPVTEASDVTHSTDYAEVTIEPKPTSTEATASHLDDYVQHPRYPTRVYSIYSGSEKSPTDEPGHGNSPRRKSPIVHLSHDARVPNNVENASSPSELLTPSGRLEQKQEFIPAATVQRPPTSNRRFKIPISFLRPSDHPSTPLPAWNFHNEAGSGNTDSYDMILDKASRESFRERERERVKVSIDYTHPAEIPSGGIREHAVHVNTVASEESGTEESKHVYSEFVEIRTTTTTTTPVPLLDTDYVNREQGRPKYRRIPIRNKLGAPPVSTFSSPSVNNPKRVTIINSQKLEEESTREIGSRVSAHNSNSKRFKAQLTPLSPPSHPPTTILDNNQEPTAKFNFPPFVNRDSHGPPLATTTMSPPEPTTQSSSTLTGGGFWLNAKPISIAAVQKTVSQEATTTTSAPYISLQIFPTEIPTVAMVPIKTVSLPLPKSTDDSTSKLTFTPSSNPKLSTRFTVPKKFNFGEPQWNYGEERINSVAKVNAMNELKDERTKGSQLDDQKGTSAQEGSSTPIRINGALNPISYSNNFHSESTTVRTNGKDNNGGEDNQFEMKNPTSNSNSTDNNNNNHGGNPIPTPAAASYSPNSLVSTTGYHVPHHQQGQTYISINNGVPHSPFLQSHHLIPTTENRTQESTSWKTPGNSLPLGPSNEIPNRGTYPAQPHFRMKFPQHPQLSQNLGEQHSVVNRLPPPQFQPGTFPEPQGLNPLQYQRPSVGNGARGQPGFVTQGDRVIPVRIHAEILSPPNSNLVGTHSLQTGHNLPQQQRFPANMPGNVQRPTLNSVRYSSNQFNPYVTIGAPVQFPAKTPPHYVREYHQHHSITKEILSQLQNSIRTSRSANLSAEEIQSLLEISRSPDKDLVNKMELMSPLLGKVDLQKDDAGDEERQGESGLSPSILEDSMDQHNNNSTLAEVTSNQMKESARSSSNNRTEIAVTVPLLAMAEEGEGRGGFKSPKTIQRGFFPILPYSDKDPGLTLVNLNDPPPSPRTSRALWDKGAITPTGTPGQGV